MWHDKLLELKKASGKTTEEIASISGIPRGTLNKIFAGVTKDPQLETIKTLLYSVGYSLNDLDDDKTVVDATDVLFETLTKHYNALNNEGRQKLVSNADDLVSSGKYK